MALVAGLIDKDNLIQDYSAKTLPEQFEIKMATIDTLFLTKRSKKDTL